MTQPPRTLDYATPQRSSWLLAARQHVPILATLVVFVLLYAGASLRYDNFFSYRVFQDLLKDNAVLGLAAIGMTFVILSGGIDLSVGAVAGLVSIGVARLIEVHGLSPALAIPIAVVTGTLFGAGQGALIAFFSLPPFLVTLAGLFLARGMAFLVSPESIGIDHALYRWAGDFGFDVFPVIAILFLATLLVAMWVAHQTRLGRATYAIGGNEASAMLLGLPVRRVRVMVYAISGCCAALAGVAWTFYTGSGRAVAGELLELDAIAAVVIGGTLLTGGVGYMAGTLIGVLIFGIIQTALTFEGTLTPYLMRIVVGSLLLGFILLQKLVQSRLGGR